MLKIGITGGIGSGKSTVCKVFELLGVPVFYADTVAKQLMASNKKLIAGIKLAFGQQSYTDNGMLNNKHIADIVFNNKNELEKLNALVHPAVFDAFEDWEKTVPDSVPYTLKEAALLFESGSYKLCHKNILVVSPAEMRLKRVMQRDGATREQVMARMAKQLTDEQKIPLADFILHNSENQSIISQVMALHHKFINLAQK